jgi:(E)-4-hydroxy-3-methylbut-2-enyl-diphosphate synthase
MTQIQRNPTRSVRIGQMQIGAQHPIAVQSMAATRTQDIQATLRQIEVIGEAGADIIRIAVDSRKDVEALGEIARVSALRRVAAAWAAPSWPSRCD